MSDGDSEEEDTFHFLGTPLDPITEEDKHEDAYSRRRPRPVPVHEQRVLDERGRPLRFHGAFQGGFSAGHFNTVADPEGRGFTPAVFVSRRQRKKDGASAPKRARPEDFMDAEDFNEFGIAPRTFHTAADFENTAARSTGDIVMDIVCPIRPIKSPIAIRLMRRFGWREGQSIGAVKNRLSSETEADEEAEAEAESALLATDAASSVQVTFVPKTNTFGLGYSGIDPRSALFSGGPRAAKPADREVLLGQRGRRGIRGQAFGVSVLEEDDDDDVYGQPSFKDYDFEIGGPEGEEEKRGGGLHGWTAPKDRKSPQKRPLGYVGKVLKGFRVGPSLDRSCSSRFPVPFLPAWFVPIRGANKGLLQEPGAPEPAAGDEASSGPGASVFDFISREDRVRLELARKKAAPRSDPRPPEVGAKEATAKGAVLADLRVPDRKKEKVSGASRWSRWDSKPSGPPPPPSPPPAPSAPEAPAVKSEPVEAASSSGSENRQPLTIHFRPFAKDKEKQNRFEAFCRSPLMQQQPKEIYAALTPPHFTEWEAQREEEEFVKAARIYRPLSSMLASRFHRGEDIQLDETTGAVKSIPLPAEKKERSACEIAASEKRFGRETRRSVRWHPHPLLCRRFNVPEPFPGSEVVGLESAQPRRKEEFSIFDLVGLGSRSEAGSAAPAAIEAPPPVMTREEVQKKRKSVFSCLFEDSTPSTSSHDETRTQRVAESANASEPSKAPEQSSITEAKDKEVKEVTSSAQPVTVAPIVPQIPLESQSKEELPSSPVLPQDSDPNGEEESEEHRIPMDIFKAIFADSEESEEEEEEKEKVKPVKEEKKITDPSRAMAASSLFRHLFEEDKGQAEEGGSSPRQRQFEEEKDVEFVRSDKGKSPSAERKPKGDGATAARQNRETSYGAALPPTLPSGRSASKELSSNEFLLRLAAGELSEKVKKTKKKKKEKRLKRTKTSKASKKSKKKKKKHKKATSSSSDDS